LIWPVSLIGFPILSILLTLTLGSSGTIYSGGFTYMDFPAFTRQFLIQNNTLLQT
jgi:hypothetical protein